MQIHSVLSGSLSRSHLVFVLFFLPSLVKLFSHHSSFVATAPVKYQEGYLEAVTSGSFSPWPGNKPGAPAKK